MSKLPKSKKTEKIAVRAGFMGSKLVKCDKCEKIFDIRTKGYYMTERFIDLEGKVGYCYLCKNCVKAIKLKR